MTTGAVMFAFNNEQTDYLKLAAWNADNIRRHLDIPVAVITDCTDADRLEAFDCVIYSQSQIGGSRYFEDYNQSVTWYNAGRTDAFDLSPWDQTLVLDADYVVASDHLGMILNRSQDFMCYRDSIDIARPTEKLLPTFGRYQFPMWWATVMMFRRTTQTEFIFESMKMVKENWQHYRDLYGIDAATYRNDYALSIALGLVSGHTLKVDAIPWAMPSLLPSTTVSWTATDSYQVHYQDKENRRRSMSFSGLDFHAMGKRHLEAVVASST